ncbi:hypothetical protein H6H01_32320 [Nostoc calcicola FACHB-3891]|nr:hypothetical protein [Nostoc calcicola FACHB-3891]
MLKPIYSRSFQTILQVFTHISASRQLEGQRYKSPARRQGYPYNSQVPQSVELQPFLAENLAKRLGVDTATLAREQKSKSQSEFESWSRNRDPSSTAWRYQNDGLFHPIK